MAYFCHPHSFSQHSILHQFEITISSSQDNFVVSQQTPTFLLSGLHKLLYFVIITIVKSVSGLVVAVCMVAFVGRSSIQNEFVEVRTPSYG